MGNVHDHVLEKGVFERVLAHEDAVIRPHLEMQGFKASRSTGRGGAGNIKRSKEDKDGCECHPYTSYLSSPVALCPTNDGGFLQRPPSGRLVRAF